MKHTSYLSQAPQAVPVEKNSAMWRNSRLNAEISPFKYGENLSHGEISPHEKCGDKSVKWKISPHEKGGENLSCGEISPHERCGENKSSLL